MHLRAGPAAALVAAVCAAGLLASSAATSSPLPAAANGPAATSPDGVRVEEHHAVRLRRTFQAAAAAVPDTVQVGSTIKIRGTAVTKPEERAAKRRPVRLVERTGATWRRVTGRRTTRAGAFTFLVEAGDVAQVRVFRVSARRFNGLPATTTRRIRVEVAEPAMEPIPDPVPGDIVPPEPLPDGYQAEGSATDWSYLIKGGSRWDQCEPIRWAYNPQGQGYAGLADVYRAFAKISGVSGLQFQYVGETSWRYLGNLKDPDFPAGVDITVTWADETELDDLAGSRVGVAGGSGAPAAAGADVDFDLSRGYLALDNGHALPGGFDEPGWGQVLLHETLHALGMGHAQQKAQVMSPIASAENIRFGAGDLTGMTQVGLPADCLG